MQQFDHTELIEIIQQKIDVSAYSIGFINNVITTRMEQLKIETPFMYAAIISHDESEIEKIKANLTNSHSLFFRNRLTFETLRQVYLPVIMTQKKDEDEIRIWSAGCAGGQEPYTLAILMESVINNWKSELKYRIFATDSNFKEIERAVLGIYSKADIVNLTWHEIDTWFTHSAKRYSLVPQLKKNVQFELFDLFDNDCNCPRTSIFGGFDIIMLANVLIYYKEEMQNKLLKRLKSCKTKQGIIITGETEREIFLRNEYVELYPNSCIFR